MPVTGTFPQPSTQTHAPDLHSKSEILNPAFQSSKPCTPDPQPRPLDPNRQAYHVLARESSRAAALEAFHRASKWRQPETPNLEPEALGIQPRVKSLRSSYNSGHPTRGCIPREARNPKTSTMKPLLPLIKPRIGDTPRSRALFSPNLRFEIPTLNPEASALRPHRVISPMRNCPPPLGPP